MRAWKVYIPDDWATLIHADTRGKAIVQARKWVDNWNEFTDFRASRFPGLDGKQITYQNAKEAGFEYIGDDGIEIGEGEFYNECHCEICLGKQG